MNELKVLHENRTLDSDWLGPSNWGHSAGSTDLSVELLGGNNKWEFVKRIIAGIANWDPRLRYFFLIYELIQS